MSKVQGGRAEDFAAAWLQRRGLRLIERNWRCRFGELDLVMRDGPAIVIVEVRQRSSGQFGGAAASVDHRKQRKLAATALLYLAGKGSAPCRIDVVLMSDADGTDIEWIRNAFEV